MTGLSKDITPPTLTIGIFQNPYLTQYLDLYLLASEALDPGSIDLRANQSRVQCRLLDADNNVWMGDLKLTPPGGLTEVNATASDPAGNQATTAARLSSALMLASLGGSLESPDHTVSVQVEPGILARDSYVVIFLSANSTLPATASSAIAAAIVAAPADTAGPASTYYIGAGKLSSQNAMLVTFRYEASDLSPGQTPDQLYIAVDGKGALDSWVDPDARTVSTTTSVSGLFRLGIGEKGSSRLTDARLLCVSEAHPNPWNRATRVRFEIGERQQVGINIYDVCGKHVASLLDATLYPGWHEVAWDGRNAHGEAVASGVYYMSVVTDHNKATRSLTMIR